VGNEASKRCRSLASGLVAIALVGVGGASAQGDPAQEAAAHEAAAREAAAHEAAARPHDRETSAVEAPGERQSEPSPAKAPTSPRSPPEESGAGEPAHDHRAMLAAHPDAPWVTVAWRGQLRGTVAADIRPLFPARRGFTVRILPLIELHNARGSDEPLPNEAWRGKLALEAGWLWSAASTAARQRLHVAIALAHESDHNTARAEPDVDPTALQLNELSLRVVWTVATRAVVLRSRADLRGLAISCTDLSSSCSNFEGAASFGADADVVLDFAPSMNGAWFPFVSTHGGGIVPNGDLVPEWRLVLHAGVYTRGSSGVWALYGLGLVGHDVGIDRADRVARFGGGIRWSPP
jgi:hypothetical protein